MHLNEELRKARIGRKAVQCTVDCRLLGVHDAWHSRRPLQHQIVRSGPRSVLHLIETQAYI